METLTDGENSIALEILGYQFPLMEASRDNYYDANWLNINFFAKCQNLDWSATDPCLLTSEIKELANWLTKVANKKRVKKHIYFTENLIDEVIRHRDHLEFVLGYKFRNKKIESTHEFGYTQLRIKITPKNLIEFAQDLMSQLEKFPVRI